MTPEIGPNSTGGAARKIISPDPAMLLPVFSTIRISQTNCSAVFTTRESPCAVHSSTNSRLRNSDADGSCGSAARTASDSTSATSAVCGAAASGGAAMLRVARPACADP